MWHRKLYFPKQFLLISVMVWSVQTWLPVSVGMPEAGVALCYPCLGVQEWQPQFPLYSHPHVQVCCVLNGILKQILTSHAEKNNKLIACINWKLFLKNHGHSIHGVMKLFSIHWLVRLLISDCIAENEMDRCLTHASKTFSFIILCEAHILLPMREKIKKCTCNIFQIYFVRLLTNAWLTNYTKMSLI